MNEDRFDVERVARPFSDKPHWRALGTAAVRVARSGAESGGSSRVGPGRIRILYVGGGAGDLLSRVVPSCAVVDGAPSGDLSPLGASLVRCGAAEFLVASAGQGLGERAEYGAGGDSLETRVVPRLSDAAFEEVDVRLSGQLPFHQMAARASGWFSRNVLRRRLARESRDLESVPDAVVAGDLTPADENRLGAACSSRGVPLVVFDRGAAAPATDVARGIRHACKTQAVERALASARRDGERAAEARAVVAVAAARSEGYTRGYRDARSAATAAEERLRTAPSSAAPAVRAGVWGSEAVSEDTPGPLGDGDPAGGDDVCRLFCEWTPRWAECPITMDTMRRPSVTPAGHSFEAESIARVARERGRDPLTNSTLSESDLVPNRALRDAINWRERLCRQCRQRG